MGQNTQSFLFTASGLLSQATGPGGVKFAKAPSTGGGQPDQPTMVRRFKLYNARAVYGNAGGEAQIFDSASSSPGPQDEIWGSVSPSAAGGVDSASDVCVIVKSGDLFVNIVGSGVKVWVYISIED